MKKILFINPTINNTVFGKMKMLALPPMGLGVLASRTPEKYRIRIIDENVDPIDFDTRADLVAVTATTGQAPRAYQIINEFKKRGVPTIMGGIHASVMTEEAARFADSVAVGEADELWPLIMEDFERGSLQPLYRAAAFPSIARIPAINRNVIRVVMPSLRFHRAEMRISKKESSVISAMAIIGKSGTNSKAFR